MTLEMEKWILQADSNEIQKIIQECFENSYSSKLENQEEIGKFS
jgi:hypothetical protein